MEDSSASGEESDPTAPGPSEKKSKPKRSMRRQLKTFSFGKWPKSKDSAKSNSKKRTFSLGKDRWASCSSVVSESSVENVTCICTMYRRTKDKDKERAPKAKNESAASKEDAVCAAAAVSSVSEGSQADFGFLGRRVPVGGGYEMHQPLSDNRNMLISCQPHPLSINELTYALQTHMRLSLSGPAPFLIQSWGSPYTAPASPPPSSALMPRPSGSAHTQVDYVHHLVPDLLEITNCGFYWGKMDRYKAERQLDRRPEGTFLLRDSAQEEFLFSVSFRRYGRTLHARIEQLDHRFSFDAHDPNVFTSPTVCGLVEHYKNPICCMFFEPMLTLPVHRHFPFDLQHLCRAAIAQRCTYDGINQLRLPTRLRSYLKEYHYKQKVRVRHLDGDA